MRAIAYIDGFNLYYGSLKNTAYKWLDIEALVKALTPSRMTLVKIRYFTALVKPNHLKPNAHTDQQAYLAAIKAACPLVEIHYGHYLTNLVRATNANPPPPTVEIIKHEEKGSDVNLAVHLLHDTFTANLNAALLISNDSDLAEAVSLAQNKGVDVYWFPPLRYKRYPSKKLSEVVKYQRSIYQNIWKKCVLPNPVTDHSGSAINKPVGW